jgi:hypothetical protein
MKQYFNFFIIFFVLAAGCTKEESDKVGGRPGESAGIYILQATSQQVSFNSWVIEDMDHVTQLNVASGVATKQDVQVSFEINNALVDEYNAAYNKEYIILPSSAYELSGNTVTIPNGQQVSSDVSLTFNTQDLNYRNTYILPVVITGGTGVSESSSKIYYIIKPTLKDFDRTDWAIHDFDSEETTGEGPNNGRAVFVLDNVLTTFWHTQWDGANPPPPHHISIDMKEAQTMHGVWVVNRQGASGGAATKVTVATSSNGSTWTDAGSYTLTVTNDKQYIYFDEDVVAQYFRITVTETKDNTNHTFFAEIGAM